MFYRVIKWHVPATKIHSIYIMLSAIIKAIRDHMMKKYPNRFLNELRSNSYILAIISSTPNR